MAAEAALDLVPVLRARANARHSGEVSPTAELCGQAADAIERLAAQVSALTAEAARRARPKCSCMEVYGEDPRCFLHGKGTEWAKANPDICTWAEERATSSARISTLEEAVRPFAEAARHLHPGSPDDGLTLDGIEVRHWRRAQTLLDGGSDGRTA